MGSDRFDDERHEIRVAARGVADCVERGAPFRAVASPAHRCDARLLYALDFRIDAECRNRRPSLGLKYREADNG